MLFVSLQNKIIKG